MHYVEVKSILSAKNGMNIYRGCTHGCIYCDSRGACYGMTHPFTDVAVKRNAPELLRVALKSKRAPCMIGTGSMSDPYLPIEKTERLTRRCAELILKEGFGLTLLTKSDLVLRDIDLLCEINKKTKCVVQFTLTTFDETLCRTVEPGVCTTRRRVEALMRLRENDIPTVVWLSPILPFINDTEYNLRGLLRCCFDAGVKGIISFGMGLTLREGNREYFYEQLQAHFPGLLARYVSAYGESYSCQSPANTHLMRIFEDECEAHGVMHDTDGLFAYLNRFEQSSGAEQLRLF